MRSDEEYTEFVEGFIAAVQANFSSALQRKIDVLTNIKTLIDSGVGDRRIGDLAGLAYEAGIALDLNITVNIPLPAAGAENGGDG